MSYLEELAPTLVHHIPELIIWSTAVTLGIVLLSRQKSRTVKLFLAGSICLLAAEFAQPFLHSLVMVRFGPDSDGSAARFGTMMTFISGLPTGLISLAGFILLIVAFRNKFREKRSEVAT